FQLAQEHVEGEERDDRAVAELRSCPFRGEAFEAEPEQRQSRDHRQGEPAEACRVDRQGRRRDADTFHAGGCEHAGWFWLVWIDRVRITFCPGPKECVDQNQKAAGTSPLGGDVCLTA